MTPKQEQFVAQYLLDLNATQAAIRAGYSKKTAASQGERLLRNVEIRSAIQAAQAARSKRTDVNQDDVIRGLHDEATYRGHGSSHSARVQAWAHLGKHLGMFVDRLAGADGGPIVIRTTNLKALSDDELDKLDEILGHAEEGPSPTPDPSADGTGEDGGESPAPAQ